MKDFRELMKEREDTIEMKKRSLLPPSMQVIKYERIHVGRFSLSIQAGFYFYSSPKENVPIMDYKSMEVAIFEKEAWVNIHKHPLFKDKEFLKSEKYSFEDCDITSVGFGIPIDVIQKLFEYLHEIKEEEEKNG